MSKTADAHFSKKSKEKKSKLAESVENLDAYVRDLSRLHGRVRVIVKFPLIAGPHAILLTVERNSFPGGGLGWVWGSRGEISAREG